jgi:hypothetical protein
VAAAARDEGEVVTRKGKRRVGRKTAERLKQAAPRLKDRQRNKELDGLACLPGWKPGYGVPPSVRRNSAASTPIMQRNPRRFSGTGD